jgi:HK97 family phage prohead protease
MTTMQRTLDIPLEVKRVAEREFEGHGSVFRNVDLGGDIVAPGAFKRSLAQHRKDGTMPLMFWMHRADMVPGVWHEMGEDARGLYVKGELVDTQLGNETRTLLQKKAVRGLSIGYRPVEVDFDDDGNKIIKEVDLWEVSIVSMAMNPLAKVEAVKSRLSGLGEYVPTEREFEARLRDVGCSRKVARAIVARVFDCDDDGSCGMPDADPLRDAVHVENETAEAEAAMKAANELVAKFCNGSLKF